MDKNTYLDFGLEFNVDKRLDKIKNNGFKGIFIWLYNDLSFLDEIISKARTKGLNIETIHLPYRNCNHLWLDTEIGEGYVEKMIRGVKIAHQYQIPTVVMHTVGGITHPMYNPLGLKKIKTILQVCEQLDVNLALENARDIRYIDYVFENIQSPRLKMCLDFGHTNCFKYNIKELDFMKYKDLIVCLHIHDNEGDDDHHLIPFYGKIDYQYIVNQLKKIGYTGPLTSEARISDQRFLFTEDEFLGNLYNSLQKIEKMFIE